MNTNIESYNIPENIQFLNTREIEVSIICGLVNNPDYIHIFNKLTTEDMFVDYHAKKIHEVVTDMISKREPVNIATVGAKLINAELVTTLISYVRLAPSTETEMIKTCELLKEFHIRRKCYTTALSMMGKASDTSIGIDELLNIPEQFTTDIRESTIDKTNIKSFDEVVNSVASGVEEEEKLRLEGKSTKITTGSRVLDYMLGGGTKRGQLVIVAARPGAGKTAFALQMARASAMSGFPTMFFDLEMLNEELVTRCLTSTPYLSKYHFDEQMDWRCFESAAAQFKGIKLYMNDKANTINDIVSQIILAHQAGRCEIAFIDYLTLIRSTSRKEREDLRVAEISKLLKQTAKDCKIPIVLLSQLSRASEKEKRPPLAIDLRDSGAIEQDADTILMLEKKPDECTENFDMRLWIRKQRGGMAGNIKIEYNASNEYTVFTEVGSINNTPSQIPNENEDTSEF